MDRCEVGDKRGSYGIHSLGGDSEEKCICVSFAQLFVSVLFLCCLASSIESECAQSRTRIDMKCLLASITSK